MHSNNAVPVTSVMQPQLNLVNHFFENNLLQFHPLFRGMVELQLPHLKWDDALPPIASFYSYAAVMKQ